VEVLAPLTGVIAEVLAPEGAAVTRGADSLVDTPGSTVDPDYERER
jgi:hypothetical protein